MPDPAQDAQAQAREQAEADTANASAADTPPAVASVTPAADTASAIERPEPRVPPARAAFADIVAKRRAALARDGVELSGVEPPIETPPPGGEAGAGDGDRARSVAEPAPAARQPDKPLPAAPAAVTAPAERFTIKVQGRDRTVTRDELIHLAQQAAAGESRYAEAQALWTKIQERTNQPGTTGQDPQPAGRAGEPAPGPAGPAAKPSIEGLDLKRIVNDLQVGDEESAEKALREVIESVAARGGGADPGQIRREVEQQLYQERVRDQFQADLTDVGQRYAPIFQDKDLTSVAAERVHTVRARELVKLGYPEQDVNALLANPQGRVRMMGLLWAHAEKGEAPNNRQVFETALNEVAAKFKVPIPGKAGPAPAVTDRTDRRASATQPPAGTSARAPLGAPPPAAKTRSQVIADMRKSRGQAI